MFAPEGCPIGKDIAALGMTWAASSVRCEATVITMLLLSAYISTTMCKWMTTLL